MRLVVVIAAAVVSGQQHGLTECPHDAARGVCLPGGSLTLNFNDTQTLKAHRCVQLQTTSAAGALCFCPRSHPNPIPNLTLTLTLATLTLTNPNPNQVG